MKRVTISFVALFIATSLFAYPIITSDFKIVKKEGNITLYERWITGSQREQVRELKAEFSVKCKIEDVVKLLKNETLGTQWNRNASAFKIVDSGNQCDWINYIRYDMPLLFDDQDCCLQYKLPLTDISNNQFLQIPFQSINSPAFPTKKGVKRITGINGEWKLEQLNNELKIIYIISSDRSTSVPRFISDPIIHQNLFKSMANFQTLLEK